jgi:LPXTG-site transpeptidase (sortase) family protein
VLAGSIALAYPLLTYAVNGDRNRRLTDAVEAALVRPSPHTKTPRADRSSATAGTDRGVHVRPILEVPAPRNGQALGVIQIPSIGLRTVFLEGTDTSTLMVGPGHLPWTSMPGTGGISVLAAHRDLQFADLHRVSAGDRIWLELPSGTLAYRVVNARVTTPDDHSIYAPAAGHRNELRLLTCWPPSFVGPAPDRLVVSAAPIPADVAPAPPLSSGAVELPLQAATTPGLSVGAAELPAAPSSGVTEAIPMLGAAGVGLASLASFASVQGNRRRGWFVAFLTGAVVLNVALTLGLRG